MYNCSASKSTRTSVRSVAAWPVSGSLWVKPDAMGASAQSASSSTPSTTIACRTREAESVRPSSAGTARASPAVSRAGPRCASRLAGRTSSETQRAIFMARY